MGSRPYVLDLGVRMQNPFRYDLYEAHPTKIHATSMSKTHTRPQQLWCKYHPLESSSNKALKLHRMCSPPGSWATLDSTWIFVPSKKSTRGDPQNKGKNVSLGKTLCWMAEDRDGELIDSHHRQESNTTSASIGIGVRVGTRDQS